MKNIFAFLTILAFATSVSFAQSNPKEAAQNATKEVKQAVQKAAPQANTPETVPLTPDGSGPVMEFESTEVDYGTIEQNSDPLRVFNFTNTGDAPLIITHAKGSCGCTVPSYPKTPIAPGESAVIEVRYDTKRIGKFTKRVTLTTNEGAEKKVLTIKGNVLKQPAEPAGVPTNTPGMFTPSGQ